MSYAVGGSGFLNNLGRIYAIYTGTFAAFVVLIGILEWMGVPAKILGYLYIFLTIGVYALIGILSRTAEVSEYYVAGRSVPAFYNGMATGADWMSGRRSSAWPAPSTSAAMAALPSCSAGRAATCWSRS